jgi:hypothetical protein
MPISVGDHNHIHDLVGGWFDVATRHLDPREVGLDGDQFLACGYVNDVGAIENQPVNVMASIMFGRELYGTCVVVSATNPDTLDADGEHYDLPEWFTDRVFDGSLVAMSEFVTSSAMADLEILMFAYDEGVFTESQMERIFEMMESDDDDHHARVDVAIEVAKIYAIGRATGTIPKFDRDEYNEFVMNMDDVGVITDEDIAKFWEQEMK